MRFIRGIIEKGIIFLCIACMMFQSSARADALSDKCQDIAVRMGQLRNAEDKQQIINDLRQAIIKDNNKSPNKLNAYLLVACLYASCQQNDLGAAFLRETLDKKVFSIEEEIQTRTTLGNMQVKSNKQAALTEFEIAQKLAVDALQNQEWDKNSKQSLLQIAKAYEKNTLSQFQFLGKEGEHLKSVEVVNDYVKRMLAISLSQEKDAKSSLIQSAGMTWLFAGDMLQQNGEKNLASQLYAQSKDYLQQTCSGEELCEPLQFQLSCLSIMSINQDRKTIVANVNECLERNASKPWLIEAFMKLSHNIDRYEEYGFLKKLASFCNDDKYNKIADLYYKLAICAERLRLENQAFFYYNELLRRFPGHPNNISITLKIKALEYRYKQHMDKQFSQIMESINNSSLENGDNPAINKNHTSDNAIMDLTTSFPSDNSSNTSAKNRDEQISTCNVGFEAILGWLVGGLGFVVLTGAVVLYIRRKAR